VVVLTNGANLTGAKTGEGKEEGKEEEEEEEEEGEEEERDFRKGDGEDFREDAEEELGFTEEPDNERMGLLGVESYEEETRGDLGGYLNPEVVDSNGDEFGPMDDDDLRVPLFGIIL
jgi:hypothetical protein